MQHRYIGKDEEANGIYFSKYGLVQRHADQVVQAAQIYFSSEFSIFFQRYLIEILYKKRIINKESETGINGLSFLLNAATISE